MSGINFNRDVHLPHWFYEKLRESDEKSIVLIVHLYAKKSTFWILSEGSLNLLCIHNWLSETNLLLGHVWVVKIWLIVNILITGSSGGACLMFMPYMYIIGWKDMVIASTTGTVVVVAVHGYVILY